MLGEVLTIVLFFVVIAITAVLFCLWLAFTVVRAILRGVFGMIFPRRRPRPVVVNNTVRCMNRGCWRINPADARFCRRCGHALPAAQRVQVRRAAVW